MLSLVPTDSNFHHHLPSSGNTDELNLLYLQEFLNTLNFNGLPPHEVKLKIKTPIMLLQNLNQSLRLCNITRLLIT